MVPQDVEGCWRWHVDCLQKGTEQILSWPVMRWETEATMVGFVRNSRSIGCYVLATGSSRCVNAMLSSAHAATRSDVVAYKQ
jgi:hypothetical protein